VSSIVSVIANTEWSFWQSFEVNPATRVRLFIINMHSSCNTLTKHLSSLALARPRMNDKHSNPNGPIEGQGKPLPERPERSG
jgi:hypothetical protein